MKLLYSLLSDTSRQAPLALLRLGNLGEELEYAGFLSIGDLLKPTRTERDWSTWIYGLGAAGDELLSDRVQLLRSFVDAEGSVAWNQYHAACGDRALDHLEPAAVTSALKIEPVSPTCVDEPCLAPSFEVTSGADFLRAFPEVIGVIVDSRDNEADRVILVQRLTKPPGSRMTLDEIASSLPRRITRERVRQRETKILHLLANALLHGRQRGLGVQFRSSFTRFWRAAAEQFGERSEIPFAQFLDGLESAWDVSTERLIEHLPFIMAVLTRSAIFPEQLRAHMGRDRRVYREVAEPDRNTPVTRLTLGKAADILLARGIGTVGEMFDAARNGLGPDPRSSAGRAVGRVLIALADSLTMDGHIDWGAYESHLGLSRLPAADPISIDAFLETLPCEVEAIIRANAYTVRALEIFRLRVAAAPWRRATLAVAAERLGTYGPSIKREESFLLSALNDLLVEGDATRSKVSISPRFLSYWVDAATIYQQCGGDFGQFRMLMVARWNISLEQLEGRAEILWAVLNRYPAGRPRRSKREPCQLPPVGKAGPVSTVVLRGFRRVH